MTFERKLLIVAGAFILALIIAVGFFSLGLYIGQKGILPDAPRITGPGGAPGQPGGAGQPGPNAPNNPPDPSQPGNAQSRPSNFAGLGPNLPPGPPDLVGMLQAVDPEGLTIGTPQGSRMVQLANDVQIFDAQGETLSVETLAVSTRLAIFGNFTDDGRTMMAETVIVLPLPGNRPAR